MDADHIAPNGWPSPVKAKIATLMADGRERTTSDIFRALAADTTAKQVSMRRAILHMQDMGLIVRDEVLKKAIWRARQ